MELIRYERNQQQDACFNSQPFVLCALLAGVSSTRQSRWRGAFCSAKPGNQSHAFQHQRLKSDTCDVIMNVPHAITALRVSLTDINAIVAAQLGSGRVKGNAQPAVFSRQIAMYLAKKRRRIDI
jgi:hypothetical protein